MVDRNDLDVTSVQSGQSCVLFSYAIACHALGGQDAASALPAYNAECGQAYDQHFHNHIENHGLSGYQWICQLHDAGSGQYFVSNRTSLTLQYVPDLNACGALAEVLIKQNRALLLAALTVPQGAHSIVVGYDSQGLYRRDPSAQGVATLGTLSGAGSLRDGLLIQG